MIFLNFPFPITATVTKRDVGDDIQNEIEDFTKKIFGGKCVKDDQCSVLSYCDNNGR